MINTIPGPALNGIRQLLINDLIVRVAAQDLNESATTLSEIEIAQVRFRILIRKNQKKMNHLTKSLQTARRG
jgi:hypothetical protein